MRLFVAVNLGDAVSRELWEATGPLRAGAYPVRWVAQDALHVTLKFLGETDAELLSGLAAVLDDVAGGFGRFQLVYGGCGVFPGAAKPRILWAGCEHQPALELIQHELEMRLAALGFPTEGKPFRPHVTVGRVKRNSRRDDLRSLVDRLERVEFGGVDYVESIDLMASVTGPGGARYQLVHRAHLGAA